VERLSSNAQLEALHRVLVREGSLPEQYFWESLDNVVGHTPAPALICGKSNKFTDTDADKPEMETRDDKFSDHRILVYYLPPVFQDQVFVRRPTIHRLYKQNVPEVISDTQFWTEYCRWKFRIPVIEGSSIFQNYEEHSEGSDLAMGEEELRQIIVRAADCLLDRDGVDYPLGYGGLNRDALGEGMISKKNLRCEEKEFRPYQILGDAKRESVIKRLNRHGSIVVEESKVADVDKAARPDQELRAAGSQPSLDRLIQLRSLEGHLHRAQWSQQPAGNSVFRARKDVAVRRVNLTDWQPSTQFRAPSDLSARSVFKEALGVVAPQQALDAENAQSSKRKLFDTKYDGIMQLLKWFWMDCPAYGEQPAKRRKSIMDKINQHHDVLKAHLQESNSGRTKPADQSVMMHLQRVVALANAANNHAAGLTN